ncbi:MAG: SIS domain-containing protein [Acidobacteriia bacterium]|nr:SIS domain-containing protein [Terriglobia bacterium]
MPSLNPQTEHSATLDEILSQPDVWRKSLQELNRDQLLERVLTQTESRKEWLFLGCGTSFYLAETAAASWTLLTGQRARALPASEPLLFPNAAFLRAPHLQAVVISRSGRTSEALRAANLLSREHRIPTLGITCASLSALAEVCDLTIPLPVADEKSTVMTRSFTSMLLALQHLAARKAGNQEFPAAIEAMAGHFASLIHLLAERVETFVADHTFSNYVFLGQGPFHGIAREGSLKVTEMSCSYGQVFHTLEFRHGPKAIVGPETCLTFYLSEGGNKAECEVLAEMKNLGGVTIAICNRANETIRRSSDFVFELGADIPELAMLAPFIVPSQLLGFFTGIKKGLNPDHPRNLTRVVILD